MDIPWKAMAVSLFVGAALTFTGLVMYDASISIDTALSASSEQISNPDVGPTPTIVTAVSSAVPITIHLPAPTEQAGVSITYFVSPEADQTVKDMLSDGKATREEYDRAVANSMKCLDEKGVQHSNPVYNEDRVQYDYTVTSPSGPGSVSPQDDCWMRYERDVQSVWVQANEKLKKKSPADEKRAVACAIELGIKAKTFEDIIDFKRTHPEDPAIERCYLIGVIGRDILGPYNP